MTKKPLVDQPSLAPTRKLIAMIIAGAIMGTIQSLVVHYFPETDFSQILPQVGVWVNGAAMIVVGYFTRNRAA
jgi:hypothetical protein